MALAYLVLHLFIRLVNPLDARLHLLGIEKLENALVGLNAGAGVEALVGLVGDEKILFLHLRLDLLQKTLNRNGQVFEAQPGVGIIRGLVLIEIGLELFLGNRLLDLLRQFFRSRQLDPVKLPGVLQLLEFIVGLFAGDLGPGADELIEPGNEEQVSKLLIERAKRNERLSLAAADPPRDDAAVIGLLRSSQGALEAGLCRPEISLLKLEFTISKSAFRLFVALDKLGVQDSRRDSAAGQEICETPLKHRAILIKDVFLVELGEDSFLLSLLRLQEPEIHLPSLGQRDPPPSKIIRIVNLLRGIAFLPELAASRIKLGIGNLETLV